MTYGLLNRIKHVYLLQLVRSELYTFSVFITSLTVTVMMLVLFFFVKNLLSIYPSNNQKNPKNNKEKIDYLLKE